MFRYVIAMVLSVVVPTFAATFEAATPSSAEVSGEATAKPDKRIVCDLPIRKDMTAVKAFHFDMRVSDPADFATYICYFRSGKGWYKTRIELPDDAVPGGWYPVTVPLKDVDVKEGRPSGWRDVEAVRIAAFRASTNAVTLALRNIRFDVSKPEAYVIWGKGRQGRNFLRALEKLGVDVRLVTPEELAPGMLDGVAFVVLPSVTLPPDAKAIVKEYMKRGGERLRLKKPLSDKAALLEEVEKLLPGVCERVKANEKVAVEEEKRMLTALRAMPSKSGERRFIWCHSARGLGGTNNWDSTCRIIRQSGFTDLIVNLAWGGYSYYPSKILPQLNPDRGDALEQCREACRKHGLKMHAWKICWRMGPSVSSEFLNKAKEEGRVQRARDDSLNEPWNCPSDPRNQQMEIDAMMELVLDKKMEGIHFDYIRYPGSICCFCDGCRKRFEERVGRPVAKWPGDVLGKGTLAKEWTAFRCSNITHVVKTVHERVRAANPNVEISAAVWGNSANTPQTIGQDWLRWCTEGWLDFVCPMDYIASPKRYAACIARQNAAMKAAGSKAKLYPGMAVKSTHIKQPLSPLVIAQEIAAVRAEGLDGFVLFSLRSAEKMLPLLREGPLSED